MMIGTAGYRRWPGILDSALEGMKNNKDLWRWYAEEVLDMGCARVSSDWSGGGQEMVGWVILFQRLKSDGQDGLLR